MGWSADSSAPECVRGEGEKMETYFIALHAGKSKKMRSTSGLTTLKRSSGIQLWTFTVVVLAMALAAVPVAAAQASQAGAAVSLQTTTHYAVGQRACKAAKPGHFTCFAMRRVEVTADTPGAMPYELAAGASRSDAMTGPTATIGPAGGLTPSDLASAYNFSSTATGTGMTVAIVDAYNDPNIDADLQTFDTQYGLATCSIANGCLKVVNQTGGSTLPADDTSGWSVEESLDVEAVHSVCQKCKIILIEANSESDADLAAAENEAVALKANVISNSYGGQEAGTSSTVQAAYNHPGTVIVASAGDDGYYDFDLLGSDGAYNQANTPSSLSTVVAVGGTSLYLGQDATRQSETVWNDNGTKDYYEGFIGEKLGAGGGGCSTVFAAPLWQSSLNNWASTACGTNRLVSDVAAVADYLTGLDIYESYNCGSQCNPGWETIGGTSLAAPVIAAMYGLAGGAHGVKYPALTLYGHLGTSSLYNVTSGGNGWCDGEGAAACGNPNTLGEGILDCDYPASGTTPSAGDAACDAGIGFNGPTGVGTPNSLEAFAPTGPMPEIGGPTSVLPGASNTWTATPNDPFPGGTATSYSWDWGDGSAVTVTTTGSAKHTYAVGGSTFTIALTVTDNYGATGTTTYTVSTLSKAVLTSPTPASTLTGTTVTFTWSVGTPGSQYDLHLSAVSAGGYDLYSSGHTTGTFRTVNGLPTNGAMIYARLYTFTGGVTYYNDYTFTALSLAQLIHPAPSSTFTGNSVNFVWTPGAGVSAYDLHLSAVSAGGYDLYSSGHITGTSRTVSGLPTNGEQIYARLYSIIGGVTYYNDYMYMAK
jgi:subtilase family serine protease